MVLRPGLDAYWHAFAAPQRTVWASSPLVRPTPVYDYYPPSLSGGVPLVGALTAPVVQPITWDPTAGRLGSVLAVAMGVRVLQMVAWSPLMWPAFMWPRFGFGAMFWPFGLW